MILTKKGIKHMWDAGGFALEGKYDWLPDYELDAHRPYFTKRDTFLMVPRWDNTAEENLHLKKYSSKRIFYAIYSVSYDVTEYLTKVFYFWYIYPYALNWKTVVYSKFSSIPRLKNKKKVRQWDVYKKLWTEQSDNYTATHNGIINEARNVGLETKRPFGVDEFAAHGFCAAYCNWLSGELFENDYVTKERVFEKIDELLAKSLHIKKLEDCKIE